MSLDNLMDFAVRTAQRAGEITLEHFGRTVAEFKGDGSEVTVADRAAEAWIRQAIAEAFPEDGLLGEEGTLVEGSSGRRWVIDPIDATRSFASGVPLYGVLLALLEEGRPVLGCCHMPALGHTLVAATGAGAWLDGKPARVSTVDRLGDARLVTSGLEYWRDWATDEGRHGLERLVSACRFARTWGDCYGYFLVATGRAEFMVDAATGNLWDYAPMVPILAEAGGRFTTLGDQPVTSWSTALASNGLLHAEVLPFWEATSRGDAAVQVEKILERRGRE